ncbi:hypothetical protein SHIRM173S_04459 [Streptomyces hirsutus]
MGGGPGIGSTRITSLQGRPRVTVTPPLAGSAAGRSPSMHREGRKRRWGVAPSTVRGGCATTTRCVRAAVGCRHTRDRFMPAGAVRAPGRATGRPPRGEDKQDASHVRTLPWRRGSGQYATAFSACTVGRRAPRTARGRSGGVPSAGRCASSAPRSTVTTRVAASPCSVVSSGKPSATEEAGMGCPRCAAPGIGRDTDRERLRPQQGEDAPDRLGSVIRVRSTTPDPGRDRGVSSS